MKSVLITISLLVLAFLCVRLEMRKETEEATKVAQAMRKERLDRAELHYNAGCLGGSLVSCNLYAGAKKDACYKAAPRFCENSAKGFRSFLENGRK